MANSKKGGTQSKDASDKTGIGKKSKGMIFTLLTAFIVILVIGAVLGGAFYFVIHNNINGLGERYRKDIQNIPVMKLALPAAPDPLDPQYLTAGELEEKYKEFRKSNEELNKQLEEAKKQQDELQKYKDEYDKFKAENDKTAQELKDRAASLDARQLQLDELNKKINGLITSGDKEGFKAYFENVDPDTAKQVYAEVVKQQQIDEGAKNFAKLYETMDAAAAAQIFEQLGNSKIDLVAATLKNIKKEQAAAIMAAMTPDFASKLMEKLDTLYKGN